MIAGSDRFWDYRKNSNTRNKERGTTLDSYYAITKTALIASRHFQKYLFMMQLTVNEVENAVVTKLVPLMRHEKLSIVIGGRDERDMELAGTNSVKSLRILSEALDNCRTDIISLHKVIFVNLVLGKWTVVVADFTRFSVTVYKGKLDGVEDMCLPIFHMWGKLVTPLQYLLHAKWEYNACDTPLHGDKAVMCACAIAEGEM